MTALVELSHVDVDRAGRRVITDASLDILPGDRLALVGRNGAGKSTLLRAIVGLAPVAGGRITAFGETVAGEAGFRALRRRVGLLFQDSDDQLFCPTVIDDVAFGPRNLGFTAAQARARAEAMLAELGLSALAGRITHRLSGGEKRLVALAGVLAMDPDVLLLDEPTTALDEANLARLAAIVDALPVAVVIVSHDGEFLSRLARRALMVEDGRVRPAVLHRHRHSHDHVHAHPGDGRVR